MVKGMRPHLSIIDEIDYYADEEWATIPDFPRYEISTFGRIFNQNILREMKASLNNHGHMKISLVAEDGRRYTKSVGTLVASQFVEPPNFMSNQVIFLDGNFKNCRADNLAWRPQWFAWKYTRQLKEDQPRYHLNLPVANLMTGNEYASILDAAISEGLLAEDIWKSTYTGQQTFPNGDVFEIIRRV